MSSNTSMRTGRAQAQASRGFTLVELLISLAAGIMVALAVVGLSREATNVFHDETRIAGAEMQLRSAIDRLRNDVSRASYMSTGNIYIDPAIYTGANTSLTTNVANIPTTYYSATHMSLGSLAGIRLFAGGSAAATALSAVNGLSPDAIELGGYFTNAEELAIGGVSGLAAITTGDSNNSCGGQTITLNLNSSPSIWRLVGLGLAPTDAGAPLNSPAYDTALNNAFEPVANTNFIVRINNGSNGATQNAQYAVTCKSKAAGWNNGVPAVYLDSSIPVTIPLGTAGENATINPVQIVRWEIQSAQIPDPMSGEGGVNGPKYDLTRTYVDAKGVPATSSTEVVAEYAVDLKFAFTEDTTSDPSGEYLGATTPTQVVYSFEDPGDNGTLATDPTLIASGTDGPQRIRSVRIRLVTRAPTPDRNAPLSAGADYVYHYCLLSTAASCVAGTAPIFARTRTLISEAALPNQARFWYR